MREILFRGKRENNGEWIYGDLIHRKMMTFIRSEDEMRNYATEFEVLPETVGQYTGLTDKTDRKIFKGDIVRRFNNNPCTGEIGHAFWDGEHCCWRRTTNASTHGGVVDTYRMSNWCSYEVVGNLYDNPELLGGTNDIKEGG